MAVLHWPRVLAFVAGYCPDAPAVFLTPWRTAFAEALGWPGQAVQKQGTLLFGWPHG